MGILKSVLFLPAVVSGFLVVKAPVDVEKVDVEKVRTLEEKVVIRRLRVEQILFNLENVASATGQMSPENAARIEPVLTRLAEDTLELTSANAALATSTDKELEEIETILNELNDVLKKSLEPEMSL